MLRIGIDLGGTKIEGVVMDEQGALLERVRVPSPSESYAAIVEALTALVSHLQGRVGSNADTPVCPVGIGTPGAWIASQQAMKNCNSTVLNGQPLLTDLEQRLGKRVRMANDANCFALSEAMDGAAAGAQSVLGVILGTGVGGGLVLDGKLVAGASSTAGEWGHTPVAYLRHSARSQESQSEQKFSAMYAQLADRACYCGRVNCVETFLSGPGLAKTAQELLGVALSAEAVFAADTSATAVTPADAAVQLVDVRDLYCDLPARSLAQVLNVFDPEAVVLGGGLSAHPLLYERLRALVPHYRFNSEFDPAATQGNSAQLLPPLHGDSSGVRGAAWLWPSR